MKKPKSMNTSVLLKIDFPNHYVSMPVFFQNLYISTHPIALVGISFNFPYTNKVLFTNFKPFSLVSPPLPTLPWFTPMLPNNASARRRQEFRLGRFCAAQALQLLGMTNQFSLPIGPSRTPIWPLGFTGSITHSSDLVLCAVTKHNHALGLDVESLKSPLPHFSALLEHVCRESVYKALFPVSKQVFNTSAYQIVPLSPTSELSGTVLATLTQSLAPALPQGTHFMLRWAKTSTHLAALCHLPLDNLKPT